jgi:hypothetical protein
VLGHWSFAVSLVIRLLFRPLPHLTPARYLRAEMGCFAALSFSRS